MAVDYRKEGKIAIFTINRPKALNALNIEAMQELYEAMVGFRDDPDLWVGIITGAGNKAFCAGADIKDLPLLKNKQVKPLATPVTLISGLELWKPLIAAINGLALGGGLELALACDLRIASEDAELGFPEVKLGTIPGWGGTQLLSRLIPRTKAAEMLFMGKPIDAKEAHRIGLVNEIVPPERLIPTAKDWAMAICQAGPLAVRAAKEAIRKGSELKLEEGLQLEKGLFAYLSGTEDFNEGVKAFKEKRKPLFKAK